MSRRSHVVSAVAALLVALVAAGPALACRCVSYPSARAQLAGVDVVFVGRVLSTRRESSTQLVTTFAVVEPLKGRPSGTVSVRHAPDTCCICGVEFSPGARVTVLAHREGGTLHTSGCTQGRFTDAAYRAALRR